MSGRKTCDPAIPVRRAQVADLYRQGRTHYEIGKAIGVSDRQVGHDLAALRHEWQARAAATTAVRLAEELAKIDLLEREAWAGWVRSQRKGRDPKGRDGNPRFLQAVQWAIDTRCELLGLTTPPPVSISLFLDGVGPPPPPAMSYEEAETLARVAERAGLFTPALAARPDPAGDAPLRVDAELPAPPRPAPV